MIGIGRALGMKAIAEGVESADQLSRLRVMDCEMGRVYYLSKPLSSEAASALSGTNLPSRSGK